MRLFRMPPRYRWPRCSRIEVIIGWFSPPRSHSVSSTSPRLVELEHAAGVDVREQPLVDRHALGHALAEARHAQRQVVGRAAHAHQRQPVVAVGGQVDVVRVAGQVVEHHLAPALLRPVEPVALDARSPRSRRTGSTGRRWRCTCRWGTSGRAAPCACCRRAGRSRRCGRCRAPPGRRPATRASRSASWLRRRRCGRRRRCPGRRPGAAGCRR